MTPTTLLYKLFKVADLVSNESLPKDGRDRLVLTTTLHHNNRMCTVNLIIKDEYFKFIYTFHSKSGYLVEQKFFSTPFNDADNWDELVRALDYANVWHTI